MRRLGFGAMRLPGKDVWGEPEDPARARAVLERVIELGINFIDSSWYYGPHVANRLIAETLHPYPKDLVIASKLGGKRTPDKGWGAGSLGTPHSALSAAAEKHRATPAQIAIAWLLARSPVMLPIPGTSSPEHLEENWKAAAIVLIKDEVEAIARDARA